MHGRVAVGARLSSAAAGQPWWLAGPVSGGAEAQKNLRLEVLL